MVMDTIINIIATVMTIMEGLYKNIPWVVWPRDSSTNHYCKFHRTTNDPTGQSCYSATPTIFIRHLYHSIGGVNGEPRNLENMSEPKAEMESWWWNPVAWILRQRIFFFYVGMNLLDSLEVNFDKVRNMPNLY